MIEIARFVVAAGKTCHKESDSILISSVFIEVV